MSGKNVSYAVTIPVGNELYQARMQSDGGTYSALRLFVRLDLGIAETYFSSVAKSGKLCPTTKLGANGPTPWNAIKGDAKRATLSVVQDYR